MSFQQLLAAHRVQPHTTSKRELDGLRAIVSRDLQDAHVPGLSSDRQFATAYNTVLQLAKMAIACAGYRTEVTELLEKAEELRELVEQWITTHYPHFAR